MGKEIDWRELIEQAGSREAAKVELARWLRKAADLVEADGWPDVFDAAVPPRDDWEKEDFIMRVCVTLSHPWPG